MICSVTMEFLLQIQHDGSRATLHELASNTPREDVVQQHPEGFEWFAGERMSVRN